MRVSQKQIGILLKLISNVLLRNVPTQFHLHMHIFFSADRKSSDSIFILKKMHVRCQFYANSSAFSSWIKRCPPTFPLTAQINNSLLVTSWGYKMNSDPTVTQSSCRISSWVIAVSIRSRTSWMFWDVKSFIANMFEVRYDHQ